MKVRGQRDSVSGYVEQNLLSIRLCSECKLLWQQTLSISYRGLDLTLFLKVKLPHLVCT